MIHLERHVNSLFNSLSYRYDSILFDPEDEWEYFNNISYDSPDSCPFRPYIWIKQGVRTEYGKEMLLNARKNLSFYHETPFVFSEPLRIETVEDGETIAIGEGLTAKAIFTPGHNPSCITWLIDNTMFTGDSYIPGLKTVTNLPGGNRKQAEESVALIKKLATSHKIYPGHKVLNQNI